MFLGGAPAAIPVLNSLARIFWIGVCKFTFYLTYTITLLTKDINISCRNIALKAITKKEYSQFALSFLYHKQTKRFRLKTLKKTSFAFDEFTISMACYFIVSEDQKIRIFNGLEKGTCEPNNHEQAFVQREETKE